MINQWKMMMMTNMYRPKNVCFSKRNYQLILRMTLAILTNPQRLLTVAGVVNVGNQEQCNRLAKRLTQMTGMENSDQLN